MPAFGRAAGDSVHQAVRDYGHQAPTSVMVDYKTERGTRRAFSGRWNGADGSLGQVIAKRALEELVSRAARVEGKA